VSKGDWAIAVLLLFLLVGFVSKKYIQYTLSGSYEEGLGKLAILTPEVVAAASASEIRCGRRVTPNLFWIRELVKRGVKG
jgi:hypothetical protein